MEFRKVATCVFTPTIQRLLVIILFILFTISYYQSNLNFVITPTVTVSTVEKRTKSILIWNSYQRFELEVFGDGHSAFSKCPINDCFITQNRSLAPLRDFDAVILNMPPLSIYKFPVDEQRRPDQRYIFFSQEPPVYYY